MHEAATPGSVPPRATSGLRAAVFAGGVVATAAGLHTAIAGRKSFPGESRHGSAAVESEIRFYGAFYAAYGLRALRVAPHADRDREGVRKLGATLFAAGLARAYGWRTRGRPHPLQIALLTIELGAPLAAIAHQERLDAARG
jgi:hypothetical protein